MDIFLYDNLKQDFIKFPVIPKKIQIDSMQKIETFETIENGELKLIGLKGAKKFSLESFFPVKDYHFLKDRTYKGMEYVNKIELWRDSRQALNIIISELNINFSCVIESFNYSIQDGSGDIYYALNIDEYKVPSVKSNQINTAKNIATVSDAEVLEDSYGIVTATNGLNVREGAGIGYDKIGFLKNGEKVKLFKQENDWWIIYYPTSGGYVNSEFIRRI